MWAAWSIALLAGSGACGDDTGATTGADTGETTTPGTSSASDASATTGDGSSGGEATAGPVDCGLAGAPGEHFITGSFTLQFVGEPQQGTPSGVFDPLLEVEVCFGLTFTAAPPVPEFDHTRVSLSELKVQTDDATGVVAATFGPSSIGGLFLRKVELGPNLFILSIGTSVPMQADQFTFELVCSAPTPYEADEGGFPIYQSMTCEDGQAAVRRLDDGGYVTDLVGGLARFRLHVP